MEWDNPAGTWWVQPDYYPDTELGFARAWDKLCSLLQSSMIDGHDVNRATFDIHLYLTDEAQKNINLLTLKPNREIIGLVLT